MQELRTSSKDNKAKKDKKDTEKAYKADFSRYH